MNQDVSHKRLNILTGEWVLVSPHRSKRPWQGKQDKVEKSGQVSYDPDCYLCPGNTRANGAVNPDYKDVFCFSNDFAALQYGVDTSKSESNGLLISEVEQGICKVICFSPDHSKSLPDLSIAEIEMVVQTWQTEYKELGQTEGISHVQILKTKVLSWGVATLTLMDRYGLLLLFRTR